MYRIYTAFLLLVIATSDSLLAQESTSLSVGTLIEHDLVTDSKDVFDIELESEMFVFGYVDQISVDVIVTILDPTGKKCVVLTARAVDRNIFNSTVMMRARIGL